MLGFAPPFTRSVLGPVLIAFLSSGSSLPAEGRPPHGDWLGWAYLDEGGDLPLRLRVQPGGQGPEPAGGRAAALPEIRFDEIVSRRYDLPARAEEWGPERVVIVRERPGGGVIRLDGRLDSGALRGRLSWLGHEGDFELMPSATPVSRMSPDLHSDAEGTYRLTDGRTLLISARFWGELLLNDLSTGDLATMIPVDTDAFFIGPALYVPAPVTARVSLTRDEEGAVTGISYRGSDDPELLTGRRLAFREEAITFESDGATLAGTLIRPDVPGRLPAVVVLGGAYWNTRGSVRQEAAVLASFGVAAFMFDKRGYGDSQGAQTVSFRQTARDAVAAVEALSARPDIAADQIGLLGRSRGAWFAPLAASLSPQVAFLALLVPPAVSPARQETTSRLNGLRNEGAGEAEVAAAREALESGWAWAAGGEGWDRHAAARARAVAAGVPEDILEAATPDDPAWEWVRLNMAYDPVPALEQVRCPVLAIFGGADPTVVAEESRPVLEAALERAGNRDVTVLTLPAADHGLRLVPEGERSLPPHRRTGTGSRGWPEVERWLAGRLALWGDGG